MSLITLVISIIFITVQYFRTVCGDVSLNNISGNLLIIKDMIIGSSTGYLGQFISSGGLQYSGDYSNGLGDFGVLLYIFNSYTKFLFGFGIEKSIGPFMTYKLTGSEFPNGVNPTLFFEVIFVYDSYLAIILSFVLLGLSYVFMVFLVKKMVFNKNNIFILATYYMLFLSCISYTFDSMNTIRNIPFAILPALIYFIMTFFRWLVKGNNRL